jgi:AcrR family transcriptional regulator
MAKREKRIEKKTGAVPPTGRRSVGRPPGRTRDAIVAAAVQEFAEQGLGGARVERISKRARTSDRMLYYHFDSKDTLFQAALEKIHDDMIEAEGNLKLHELDPREGLKRLISFIWHYFYEHPAFISLVNAENLYAARHARQSARIQKTATPQLRFVEDLLSRGISSGQFRRDVGVVELHLTIVSLCYYYLSNAATMSNYLGYDMKRADKRDAWLSHITQVILDFLMKASPARP